MKRGKGGTKKPSARPAARSARKAAPAKASPAKTAHAAGKGKDSKPAPKPAPKAASKPAAKPAKAPARPEPQRGSAPAKPRAPANEPKAAPVPRAAPQAGKSAKTGRSPAPAVVLAPPPAPPKVEAPAKFRREYRKWLERLISLRHKLLQDSERLGEEGLKALEQEVSVDHMADYGSDSYEQDTTLALIENKSEAVRDVDAAIRRIEIRTYGLCEDCEQLIPVGRLEVLPHARYCVQCQAKREGVPT